MEGQLSMKAQIAANCINKSYVGSRMWAKLTEIVGKDATVQDWDRFLCKNTADQLAEICGVWFFPGWGHAEYIEYKGVVYPTREVEEPVGEGFLPVKHTISTTDLREVVEDDEYPDTEISGYLPIGDLFNMTDEQIRETFDLE
jgi:hypothetical protein